MNASHIEHVVELLVRKTLSLGQLDILQQQEINYKTQ